MRRNDPEELLSRKTRADENGCILWIGALNSRGYGVLGIDGKHWRAHRLSWSVRRGPIPDGLQVLHRCDVRNCVNVDHLFLGTQLENVADTVSKNRTAKGSKINASRLTRDQAIAIRNEYAAGVGSTTLGRKYGISKGAAYAVATGFNGVWVKELGPAPGRFFKGRGGVSKQRALIAEAEELGLR